MNNVFRRIALLTGVAIGMAAIASPANAGTGCNGVVNPFVWGCAPWDNNNGPQFPYYKKKTISVPADQVRIEVKDGRQMANHNGQWYPVISTGGGNVKLIGQAGGN